VSILTEQARPDQKFAPEMRWYLNRRRQHNALYEPDANRAPDRDVLAALVADGVAAVRGFLPRDVVDQIVSEVRADVEAVAEDRYAGPLRVRAMTDAGLHRIYEPDDSLSPASRAFFQSPFLRDLANSLCRDGMHVADRYVDYKVKVGGWDESVEYHIDHWKIRFKAFLLLEDVTEDQAPFHYVLGSHRNAWWRERWEWGYQHKGSAGATLPSNTVARIRRRSRLEERTYTGKAGDLFLADTRGIHRGTPLNHGTRLQLVQLFVMNGPPDYAC
jgi:Phytanoyl-CoA dioxygenase (PhyH)